MDISTIQMHLDNFVNTWQGWAKIVDGLSNAAGVSQTWEFFKSALSSTVGTFSSK